CTNTLISGVGRTTHARGVDELESTEARFESEGDRARVVRGAVVGDDELPLTGADLVGKGGKLLRDPRFDVERRQYHRDSHVARGWWRRSVIAIAEQRERRPVG